MYQFTSPLIIRNVDIPGLLQLYKLSDRQHARVASPEGVPLIHLLQELEYSKHLTLYVLNQRLPRNFVIRRPSKITRTFTRPTPQIVSISEDEGSTYIRNVGNTHIHTL
jgi:hypothetical protein